MYLSDMSVRHAIRMYKTYVPQERHDIKNKISSLAVGHL
jgi:hypothetical protein